MWLSVNKKIYKKNPGGISDNLTAPFDLRFGVIISTQVEILPSRFEVTYLKNRSFSRYE